MVQFHTIERLESFPVSGNARYIWRVAESETLSPYLETPSVGSILYDVCNQTLHRRVS